MLIACDVDGVLADLMPVWLARYNADYRDRLTEDAVMSWSLHEFVKPECGRRIYEYLTAPDLYRDVAPVTDAVAGVQALRGAGHQVVFVSACTYGMTDQKAAWLERWGFVAPVGDHALPPEFITSSDKSMVRADVLIDDGPHNIQQWWARRRRASILYRHSYNTTTDVPAMRAASDWYEVCCIVDEMESHRPVRQFFADSRRNALSLSATSPLPPAP